MPDEFGMQFSFSVDDGELDGLSPQEIFVLGYELGSLVSRVEFGVPFDTMFHSNNETRLKIALDAIGADYTIQAHDDWPILIFEG